MGNRVTACRMRRAASEKSSGSKTGSTSRTASRSSGGICIRTMYSTTPLGVTTAISTSAEPLSIVCQFSTAVAISSNHSRAVPSDVPRNDVFDHLEKARWRVRLGEDRRSPTELSAKRTVRWGCGHKHDPR